MYLSCTHLSLTVGIPKAFWDSALKPFSQKIQPYCIASVDEGLPVKSGSDGFKSQVLH